MAQRTANRFKRGSGVFKCEVCGRQTRDTGGDNTQVRCCSECYEMAGIENEISDGYFRESPEELAKAEARIAELTALIQSKGGKL